MRKEVEKYSSLGSVKINKVEGSRIIIKENSNKSSGAVKIFRGLTIIPVLTFALPNIVIRRHHDGFVEGGNDESGVTIPDDVCNTHIDYYYIQ